MAALTNPNGLGGTPVWTQLAPTGSAPGPLFAQGAVFDPANQRMIVVGGRDVNGDYVNGVIVLAFAPHPADAFPVRYAYNLNLGDSVINLLAGERRHGARRFTLLLPDSC